MTEPEIVEKIEELYAKADKAGCCVIPAEPIPPPEDKEGK